jgi:spore coat protein A
LVLFESTDEYGRLKPMLGTVSDGVLSYMSDITENIALNSTEVWEIYNATEDAHPIHLHLVKFQALSRQKYFATVDQQTGKLSNIRLVGQPHVNNLSENGWKDTEIMFPGEVTRIIATFDLPGLYEWHCHILSHEDHEMMRPFYVGTPGAIARTSTGPMTASQNNSTLISWPNPFHDFTQVQCTLTGQSFITVNIYDIQGRKIQQVYNGIKQKGTHQFVINAKNWSNGIYFCEVNLNGRKHLLKLILQQ